MKEINIEFGSRTEQVEIYSVDDFPYNKIPTPICTGKHCSYINIPATFDIETTTIVDKKRSTSDKERYIGFMYIWQFCVCDYVCMGRTWDEYLLFLDNLKHKLSLNEFRRLAIYVHYLAFEFQFSRNFIEVEDIFARKKRVPLRVKFNEAFEYRCSYFLSNMSLAKLIENTPNARFNKQSGDDFDYSKVRLPNTELSDLELAYCYCDVRGLSEAIQNYLKEDTIASIPMTSTGFLRRDVRKVVLANPENVEEVKRCRLTPSLYVLCKSAARGGNTHANAIYANEILTDLTSKDRKSSYPAEMVVDNYPVTAFRQVRPTKENLDTLLQTSALLIDFTLYNVRLKRTATIPYIPLAKCTRVTKPICDNGRIASADELSIVCTDIDFKIIKSQYYFSDTDIYIRGLFSADYGKLNKDFRNLLMEYFEQKTILETGDPYLYAKFKNKINAFFGMMLTDICNPEVIYDAQFIDCWATGDIDIEYMLNKHYNSRQTFLTYQHGLWVTANARKRLQDALDVVGDDAVYTDTDSVKYIENHDKDFKRVNDEWLADCENNDIKPYVTVRNKRTYLGTWENDGEYEVFKTLGAKKYAYTLKNDPSKKLHITVAGLSKAKGAIELTRLASLHNTTPIEEFAIGTVIKKGSSGRTVAYYNDLTDIEILEVDGTKITIGSNIAVINAEYTFGISDDYFAYLTSLDSTIQTKENNNEADYIFN